MDAIAEVSPPRLPGLIERSLGRPAAAAGEHQPLDPAKRAATRKVAEQFTSVFFSQMLEHMWAGVEVDENFGGGHGEEMFRGLMVNEYGKQLSGRDGGGLTDAVYRELIRVQEV
ncbi:MAG: chemotactic signal-response protein chel [Azospirillum sp.]|nr:chemotactic signal-response protein chel [Azospirillum sp.]